MSGARMTAGGELTPRRTRPGASRMIGRWPEGIRFEDAVVPGEGSNPGSRARIVRGPHQLGKERT